jgi:hypothetical protein
MRHATCPGYGTNRAVRVDTPDSTGRVGVEPPGIGRIETVIRNVEAAAGIEHEIAGVESCVLGNPVPPGERAAVAEARLLGSGE